MNQKELLHALKEAGLDEHEAQVYLAGLSLGPSSVSSLAQTAGVKRTTVYPTFERLQKMGLMNIEMQGFKRRYVSESPARVLSLIEERQNQFRKSLGDLHALYDLRKDESTVKHYNTLEGIKEVYNSLIRDVQEGNDYLILSSGTEWFKLDPKFFRDFLDRRAKLKIKVRALFVQSKFAENYNKTRRAVGEDIRMLPPQVNFSANIVITPQRILIHQLGKPGWGLTIENQAIIKTFQAMYEMIWSTATQPI